MGFGWILFIFPHRHRMPRHISTDSWPTQQPHGEKTRHNFDLCVPDIRFPPQVRDIGVLPVIIPTAAIGLDYDVGGQEERKMFLRMRGKCGDDMETDMNREANRRDKYVEDNLTDRSRNLTPATWSIVFQSLAAVSTALSRCDEGSRCLTVRIPLLRDIHSRHSELRVTLGQETQNWNADFWRPN